MTAIAGCVGVSSYQLEAACRAMLLAQRDYGQSESTVRSLPGATFGSILSQHVPEDVFDRQPLTGGDRYFLVADIRLDNREEVIRDLNFGLPEARNQSDADILLRAWMQWEERSLDRIAGDFAFALFDMANRSLTLARDPTGQKPLFFAKHKDFIAFSSMPSGLLNCPFLKTGFRLPGFASMLVGLPDPSDSSYFEGISRVLPGHMAIITPERNIQRTYWTPPIEYALQSNEDFVQAYEEILDTAVRSRLRRKSGHVGVQLSSGYDSSAVAATAAQLNNDRPIAFTSGPRAGFDGPVPRGRIGDESGLAALTAEMHGMRHIVVRPTAGVLANLRAHSKLYQEPGRKIVNMEWWSAILSAARDQGVSTLLTGQLGNLTIHAGGLPILAEWVRRGEWIQWWSEARAASRRPGVHWRGVLINSFGSWLPRSFVQELKRTFQGTPKPTDHSFLRDHWGREICASDQAAGHRSSGNPYRDRLALIRAADDGLIRKGALAESGIDERDPTADRRLIDFSFTLPPEQLLHQGVWRPLARRALAGRLPRTVVDAPLRGYQGADWFERFNPSEAREVLEEIAPCPAVSELLDLEKLRTAIDEWPREGRGGERLAAKYRNRLTSALSTGVFLQEFEPLMRTSSKPAG